MWICWASLTPCSLQLGYLWLSDTKVCGDVGGLAPLTRLRGLRLDLTKVRETFSRTVWRMYGGAKDTSVCSSKVESEKDAKSARKSAQLQPF